MFTFARCKQVSSLLVALLVVGVTIGCSDLSDDDQAVSKSLNFRIEQIVVTDEGPLTFASDWLARVGVAHKFMYTNGTRLILDRPLTKSELTDFLNEAYRFDIMISNDVIELSLPVAPENGDDT